jgi:tripartite-type tricarboxylate transporter receptor subunit TctC
MFEPMVSSPEEFAGYIKRDGAKWGKVLREANIKID